MDRKGIGGQPTKFTPEHKEKLLVAIRKGAPYELACNYARICFQTFLNWRAIAENEKRPEYVEFFDDLKEAQGHTALIWLDKIDKAMNEGLWTAAAWKLERRHHKHFSLQAGMMELSERLYKLEHGESKSEERSGKGIAKDDEEGQEQG